MRYLIVKPNISEKEILARMEYIYDVFNLYTLKDSLNSAEEIVVLQSIPKTTIDLFMIVGHDRKTDDYMKTHYKEIQENNIVIIACNTSKFKCLDLFKNKNVYIPKNKNIISSYSGQRYGFDFEITDEEIMLYRNRSKDIEKMLKNTLERIDNR